MERRPTHSSQSTVSPSGSSCPCWRVPRRAAIRHLAAAPGCAPARVSPVHNAFRHRRRGPTHHLFAGNGSRAGRPPVAVARTHPPAPRSPGHDQRHLHRQWLLGRQTACVHGHADVVKLNAQEVTLAFGESVPRARMDVRSISGRPPSIPALISCCAAGRADDQLPRRRRPASRTRGRVERVLNDRVSRLIAELDAERPEALPLLEGYNDLLNYGVSAADTVVNALRTGSRRTRLVQDRLALEEEASASGRSASSSAISREHAVVVLSPPLPLVRDARCLRREPDHQLSWEHRRTGVHGIDEGRSDEQRTLIVAAVTLSLKCRWN